MTFARLPLRRSAASTSFRPRLECLEDRAVPAVFNVTTFQDNLTPGDGKRTLREAVNAANATPGTDAIVLPAGIYRIALAGAGEDANAAGDFDITDSVTITGAGRGLTFLDAQQLDRVLNVIGTPDQRIKGVLQGLTVRNGKLNAGGGGINAVNADLVVRDCAVVDNQALSSSNGFGGGIAAAAGISSVKLVRSAVARNVTDGFGGGILADTATLVDSAVRKNTAAFDGGGINAPTATLTNSTVSGNSAGLDGGGISATTATLTNCTVSDNSAADNGGGIAATTATLTRSTVSGNSATTSNGGGIAATTANLTNCPLKGNSSGVDGGGISAITANLTNSTVKSNSSGVDGGGISAFTANLTNCTVSENLATGFGGGISASAVNLTRSTVSENFAVHDGGGIFAETATLSTSTVSGNSASVSGGGIGASTATLTRCTLSGNSAGLNGGGIFASTATLTSSTVSGNSASFRGGGISADTATLTNCTVAKNLAFEGGGHFHSTDESSFILRNTIVALNLFRPGGSGPDVIGFLFGSLGHNLIGDGTGGTGFTDGDNGDMVGTAASPIDPKLGPLQNNGGPTKTMALLAGSRAIDRGDNAGAPTTDQRGQSRRKDGNGDGVATVDIGAFER